MKKFLRLVIASSLALGIVGSFASAASAQARQAVAVSGSAALSTPPEPLTLERRDDGGQLQKHPMGFAGVGVKVGLAGVGAGSLTLSREGQTYESRIDARRGLHIALPIDLGGGGFGWRFEPYISLASVAVNRYGVADSGETASLTSYGMYTGPMVHIQVMRPLYLGIGAGIKAAYVNSDKFDLAVDAYVRAPVSATYYLKNQVALVAELGFGYGASVYFNQPQVVVDPVTRTVSNQREDPQFGKAFAWDCAIGVRLP